MKLKISLAKIFMSLIGFGIIILVRYALSDMELDVDLLRESLMNMPGIVMENIKFSREFSGDIWSARIPYLDRDGDTVNFKSVDLKRELSGDKGVWSFFGQSGTYSHDVKTAEISGLTGSIEDKKRTWTLESPKLTWQEKNNTFTFPEGLTIFDGEFLLRTPLASTDSSGVILLEHGGVIKWSKPLKR